MPRKRGLVEIGVVIGLLAGAIGLVGCVSGPAETASGAGQQVAIVLMVCDYTVEGARSGLAEATCPPDDEAPNPDYDPRPLEGAGTPPPDGLDYIRSVQCGGLLWALEGVSRQTTYLRSGPYRYKPAGKALSSMAGLYREWANVLAREAGRNAAETDKLVLRDMRASREDFLANAGTGTHEQKTESLQKAYPGDVAACQSTADAANAGIITIMGG